MTSIQLFRKVLFSRPHFRALILFSSLGATALGLLGPFFQKEYIDLLLGSTAQTQVLENLAPGAPSWILMIFSFISVLGYLGLSQLTNFLGAREAILMQGDLSQKLYDQALTLRSDSLQGHPIGEMVAVYATDVSGATFLLEQSLPTGASILFPLVLAPWVLHEYFRVPWGPLLGLMGFVAIFNFSLAFRQSKFFYRFKKLAAERIGLVSEWINNLRALRILGWTKPFEARIHHLRLLETDNRITMVTNGQVMNSVASSITFVMNIVLVFALTSSSSAPVSSGTLFALLWIVGVFLTRPFRAMPWVFTFVFDSWTSIKRLSDFLLLENQNLIPRKNEFQKIHEPSISQPVLQIKNLNLKIGEDEVLKSVNFEIFKGEFVAIVGEVGAGKTMLLLSLMGETGAQFDQYSINGNSALELPLHQLRQFFTFIPQEGFIMSASLRENVAFDYDVSSSQDSAILQSLERAQFNLNQERVTEGLNTEIGERGVNLSGGQKQRVSLARVDFYQAPIILMDDCLSAVDVNTEDKLMGGLIQGAWENRTRLLVTHRLTVLDEVDRILFLENGRIIASGTFTHLLKTNPKFQDFAATVAAAPIENEQPLEDTIDLKGISDEDI
jgi:ABC-type multidrug transport system fused ATPase/permease subunit